MSNVIPDPPIHRYFSRQEMTDFAKAWAEKNLADMKKRDRDLYYTRLGLLIDYSTDLFDNPPF